MCRPGGGVWGYAFAPGRTLIERTTMQSNDMPNACADDWITQQGRNLTSRQRVTTYIAATLANDLDRGSVAEQHTAALLRLVADAVERKVEAELVRVGREWARQREAGHL